MLSDLIIYSICNNLDFLRFKFQPYQMILQQNAYQVLGVKLI